MGTAHQPLVYEIHTAAFLHRIRKQLGRDVQLGSVPSEEWDRLADLGVQCVWLMGVWLRSPAGTRLSMSDKQFFPELAKDIPDLQVRDVIGSAYCVREYRVDPLFGGEDGLAAVRAELIKRGITLMLDFVPNHVAPDHSWTSKHPDYFITGTSDDFNHDPASYLHIGNNVFARGRDPHYAAWPDVVQLNAFSVGYRAAAVETLRSIAGQSDAVRCDMAMLMCSDIFAKTWSERAGAVPNKEFWTEVITEVHKTHPDFVFLAESYWDTEKELLRQGFDYCYDKTLYDKLLESAAQNINDYLVRIGDTQNSLCRFIENHDEQRAASVYDTPKKARAAAAAITTLPGMPLIHDGQMQGWCTKIPVHINHGPDEQTDNDLMPFYEQLLTARELWQGQNYTWHLWHVENSNILAWEWRGADKRFIIFINYSNETADTGFVLDEASTYKTILGSHTTATRHDNMASLNLRPWETQIIQI